MSSRPLSARWRITFGSIAVAAVLLFVALMVVRGQVATILTDADASLARSDLASFAADIRAHPDEELDDPGPGVLVFIRGADGSVEVDAMPHDVAELVESRPPGEEEFTVEDDDGRGFVVVGTTVTTSTGTWALWSARSTASSELALEGLDRVLVVGGLALLLGFGAASWIIATLALRPVQAATARERQMVSDAAHELRTPLAALRAQLELAHEDFGDAAALAEHVRGAETSVGRLSALTTNLLELSRLEASTGSDASSPASTLAEEFTAAIDRARVLATKDRTTVDFSLAVDDGESRYRVDRQSFGRVLDNLLSNALTAVGPGGAVVASLAQSAGALSLAVADDGPGMPEDFLRVAFERFTRPDSSRAASTGGSGLGLALVATVANEAGGSAVAENTRPGLTVTVTLPKM